MSDAMSCSCDNCFRSPFKAVHSDICEDCANIGGYRFHKFPEELVDTYHVSQGPKPVTFVDKIKEALPKPSMTGTVNPVYIERHTEPTKEKFSLDKLINDHWKYVEEMLRVHGTEEEAIDIVGFHYKTSGKHFWKHCCEHYGIEEKNDD